MLMTQERRPAIRTLRGWAISVLQEAGAILECEEHGWMQDRADPPPGVSSKAAAAAIQEFLDSIGDTCPECPTADEV